MSNRKTTALHVSTTSTNLSKQETVQFFSTSVCKLLVKAADTQPDNAELGGRHFFRACADRSKLCWGSVQKKGGGGRNRAFAHSAMFDSARPRYFSTGARAKWPHFPAPNHTCWRQMEVEQLVWHLASCLLLLER